MGPGEAGSAKDYGDLRSNSKGKGKAIEATPQPQEKSHGNHGPSSDNSITTRILDSAVALTRDAAQSPPGPSDMNSMSPADKAGRSSQSAIPLDVTTSRMVSSAGHTKPGASFKSAHVEEHVASQEAAFSVFLNGESTQLSTFPPTHHHSSIENSLSNNPAMFKTPSVAQQAQRDGMDVVELLDSADYDSVAELDEADVALSPDEAAALRRALFQDGDSQKPRQHDIDWNILNFFPNFVTDSSPRWGYNELPNHMGVTDPIEARDLWVDQWQHVLSDYTDEVWGDLGSLVDEAGRRWRMHRHGNPMQPVLQRCRHCEDCGRFSIISGEADGWNACCAACGMVGNAVTSIFYHSSISSAL